MLIPRRFKNQNIRIDERGVVHIFEEDDNAREHLLSLDCCCHATPFTVIDEMEGMEIDRTGCIIFRCLRHNRIMPTTKLKEATGGNMQLDDNEGTYQIQDASNMMPPLSMKGIFSAETARLLHEQIDGVYDVSDLMNMS